MTINRFMLSALALMLFGCVTINIYFPEAAAQEAADRIIDEVRGVDGIDGDETSLREARPPVAAMAAAAHGLLEILVPAAQAQANFDASSPASRALEQSLKARFPRIKPYLDAGAVGLTAAGSLEVRDRNAVPLAERNTLRQLISEQNADWEALYKEIARINGRPEWLDQIRATFAERWVAKADRGWYYRDAGGTWKQK